MTHRLQHTRGSDVQPGNDPGRHGAAMPNGSLSWATPAWPALDRDRLMAGRPTPARESGLPRDRR
jgi:hypothetical protein